MNVEGRAWVWDQKGDASTLRLVTQAVPKPEAGEIVVANRSIALNPVDWKSIEAGHDAWSPGHIPGVDGVGTIVAVATDVSLQVGSRVAYHQDLARDGSFASYTRISAKAALQIPTGLSDAVAASVPCPGLTAWQALEKVPSLRSRDVLITGGGGVAGFYLVQLAIQRGLRVWTTASPAHRDRLLALGIVDAFDYHVPDWRKSLQAALGSRKLFAAFDTISELHAQSLAPLVGYNGHIVCIQDRLPESVVLPFTKAMSQHEVALNAIYGYGTELDWQALREASSRMMEQLASNTLQMPSVIPYSFEHLPSALIALKQGKQSGKFVASVPSQN